MKQLLLFLSIISALQLSAQPCAGGKYQNFIFPNVTLDSVTYSTQYGLKMDIYQPVGDTLSARPLIVLAHGGSFIEGTREDDGTVDSLCINFARRGYVTVSIDYRLASSIIDFASDSSYALSVMLATISDAKAAVRYFYRDALTTNTYKIDTNNIFIGGNSEVGTIGLQYGYIQSVAECPADIQAIMDTSGGLAGNSGNAGYSDKVKAIINLSGGLNVPALIVAGSMPVVSAQGSLDDISPYYCGYFEAGEVQLTLCGLGDLQPLITDNTTGSSSLVFAGDGHVPWQDSVSLFGQVDTLITAFLLNQVCNASSVPGLPLAVFTSTMIGGCDSIIVQFTAVADTETYYGWTFPGSSQYVLESNQATVIYPAPGTYSASLHIVNSFGQDSSTQLINVAYLPTPEQPLCLVTPDSNNTEQIVVWEKADKYATDSFFIYRTNTPDSNYQQIAAIPRDSLSEYDDTSAHPAQMSYRYKMNIKDTCGHYSILSNYHQTIYLQYQGSGNFEWTPYVIENDTSPVTAYDFYRDSLGNGNWSLLASLPNTQTTASDPDFSLYPNARYKVVVTLSSPCTPTRSIITITSNVLTHAEALSIADIAPDKISLQPNPAHDKFEVLNSNPQDNIKSLTVFDQLGNKLSAPYSISGVGRISVDISTLAAGLYYVVLNYDNSNAAAKVVKY